MTKLDEAIAVVFEERGGQSFHYDEAGITHVVTSHLLAGRKVWVFRKAETWDSRRPSSGSGSTE